MSAQAAFWHYVEQKEPTECWPWTGTKDKDGYGQLRFWRRGKLAHRISWELHFSPPGRSYVLHKCDNPGCVNPQHLFLGDAKANMHDCIKKGRHTPTIIPQEEVPNIIREYNIRCGKELKKLVIQELATRYKVSWYTIRGIVNGVNRRTFA